MIQRGYKVKKAIAEFFRPTAYKVLITFLLSFLGFFLVVFLERIGDMRIWPEGILLIIFFAFFMPLFLVWYSFYFEVYTIRPLDMIILIVAAVIWAYILSCVVVWIMTKILKLFKKQPRYQNTVRLRILVILVALVFLGIYGAIWFHRANLVKTEKYCEQFDGDEALCVNHDRCIWKLTVTGVETEYSCCPKWASYDLFDDLMICNGLLYTD